MGIVNIMRDVHPEKINSTQRSKERKAVELID
jgi:hypothetical protein